MRYRVQAPLAAAAATVMSVVLLAGSAVADNTYPSQGQVDAAKADVSAKAHSVAALRQELSDAQARVDSAMTQAEVASEAYNGALWKLSLAKKASRKATREAAAARKKVKDQRAALALLVVQSYQQGNALNSMTALMSQAGPAEVMSRAAVVDMAGNGMEADFDTFRSLSAQAKVAQKHARKAEHNQSELTAQAAGARDAAQSAANSAVAMQQQVAHQRDAVIVQLAKAQKISVALAGQRQTALEEIAARKARAAAAAKARAEAAAAAAAAEKARQRAEQAKKDAAAAQNNSQNNDTSNGKGGDNAGSTPAPSDPPPAPDPTPPAPSGGVSAAIAFAKAQLGEPYQWGATGPSTWDCSGLTMRAWQAGGISLPHYSAAQYDMGTPISVASARPGDLLFWSSNGRPSGIHHVALSLGGGQFIEAPHTGSWVRYNSVDNWYPSFAVRL